MKTVKSSKRPPKHASASSAEGGKGSPAVSGSAQKPAKKRGVKHAIKKQSRREGVKKAAFTASPGSAEAVGRDERTSKSRSRKTGKAVKVLKRLGKKKNSTENALGADAAKNEWAGGRVRVKRSSSVSGRKRRTILAGAKRGNKRLSRREKRKLARRGIIYIGHLPVGFMEPQLRAFFSQFGEVTRVRLFRSRKTAHSKGYGFVEFALREVATVAAEAMNKYRMFGRTLVCSLTEPGQVSDRVFRKTHKPFRRINWQARAAALHNKPEGQPPSAKGIRSIQSRLKKKAKLLEALGIDFDVPLLHADTSAGETHLSDWVQHERLQRKKAKELAKKAKKKAPAAVNTAEKRSQAAAMIPFDFSTSALDCCQKSRRERQNFH
ncbi:hypothetical protein Esti_004780 [Eimeria stiedai]